MTDQTASSGQVLVHAGQDIGRLDLWILLVLCSYDTTRPLGPTQALILHPFLNVF